METSNRYRIISRIAAVCIYLMCNATTAFAQQALGTSIYLDKDLTARVEAGSEGLTLSLVTPKEATRGVDLPAEIDAVDTIAKVYDSQIAVVGEVSSSGKEVVVYDKKGHKQLDKFLCYQPTISPNGAYIAFTKFFPGHFVTEQQASNYAMLYDLKSGAVSNRAIGTGVDEMEDVGSLLYPQLNGSPENGASAGLPVHTFMSDNYFWSQDSAKVLFLDEQYPTSSSRPVLSFVLVDVSSQLPKVSVLVTDLCATESGPSCLVRLSGALFDENQITAELQGFGVKAAFHRVVTLPVAQFAPLD